MPRDVLAPETPALVLEPTDRAPALARRFLSERFRELGCTDDHIGRLVITELVTNAYRHVAFGPIIVRVFPAPDGAFTVIEVWDQGGGLPTVQPRDREALHGRGLLLISELVHDWGVRTLDEGKVVWARCGA